MQLLEEKILKPQINTSGYWTIGLYKNGKRKLYRIHRLIGKAFIPNPYNKPEINHKDGNKLNNHIENLEWVTTSENTQHAWDTKLHVVTEKLREVGKRHSKLYFIHEGQRKKTNQYDLDGTFIKEWESIKDASEKLNVQPTSISECCNGKRKTAGGFIWEFKN